MHMFISKLFFQLIGNNLCVKIQIVNQDNHNLMANMHWGRFAFIKNVSKEWEKSLQWGG